MNIEIGRRYERLLFFSGPLSLVCLFILFIAYASSQQTEQRESRCYRIALNMFQTNHDAFNKAWIEHDKLKKSKKIHVNQYHFDVRTEWIHPSVYDECSILDNVINSIQDESPDQIIHDWTMQLKEIEEKPLSYLGVDISKQQKLSIFGTSIIIKLNTLVIALQITLFPILLLWLGSLYNTRHREARFISNAQSIHHIFPHFINQYPELPQPYTQRKKSNFLLFISGYDIVSFIFSLVRIGLLLLIISPPILSYLIGLFLTSNSDNPISWANLIFGISVSFFSFGIIIFEFTPPHFSKVFIYHKS